MGGIILKPNYHAMWCNIEQKLPFVSELFTFVVRDPKLVASGAAQSCTVGIHNAENICRSSSSCLSCVCVALNYTITTLRLIHPQ